MGDCAPVLSRRTPARVAVLAILIIWAGGCGASSGGVVARSGPLEVIRPWIPAPASADVAALYLTVRNTGSTPDVLLGASSPAATAATVHADNPDGTMSPTGPMALAAGASLVLAPGGRHVMLDGLTRHIARGESVVVTLRFAHAGPVTFPVRVVAATASVMGPGM